MELKLLKIFIFAFVIYCVSAKRFGGGGGSRSSGSYRPSRPSSSSWGHSPSHTQTSHSTTFNRPSSTSSNSGRTSSSNFLHAESGRPSLPANSHPSNSFSYNPRPSVSHTPSAPVHPTNTHTSSYGKPSGVVNDHHQQSSAPVSHNSPYDRQPAYNPHVSSSFGSGGGSHSSPPYPVNQPSHPHPSNVGSSSFPSGGGYHPPTNSAYQPPINSAYHPPINSAYHPPSNTGYHPPINSAYQPPINSAYHPPSNAGYHPPINSAYHPPSNAGYHPPINSAYHPPSNAGYHPGGAYQPPVSSAYHPPYASQTPHTVYVVQDGRGKSGGSTLGSTIAGGVAGGVAAGATNAIVNHAIDSIFRPNTHHVHTYPSAPVGYSSGNTPSTSITNNYYYNNGAPSSGSAPVNNGQPDQTNSYNGQPAQTNTYNGQPAQTNSNNGQPAQTNSFNGQPAQPSQNASPTNNQGTTSGNNNGGTGIRTNGVVSRGPSEQQPANASIVVSDEDIMKLSEELFDNLNTRINQYVELNLQKRVTEIFDGVIPDEASEPLFIIKPGLDSLPTVSKLKALYNIYQRNGTAKEIFSADRQNKENEFLDEIMRTPVMKKALDWLAEKHYIKPNEYDKKELLKNMWFTVYGDTTSSGFEHVYLSENFGDAGILGMQDWIYTSYLEDKKIADYLGYMDMLSLSGKGALLKVNMRSEGQTMQGMTMFVGTPPELTMALYTVCIHTKNGGYCPVSLGGAKFFLIAQGFQLNNNTVLDIGLPVF